MIKPQKQFPLLAEYKEVFEITDNTIFAYNGNIYCNSELPDHLIVHESTHLRQQDEIGLDKWVELYLSDPNFRLKMELEAYRKELASMPDREKRNKRRISASIDLASTLYGNIITRDNAFRLLKI